MLGVPVKPFTVFFLRLPLHILDKLFAYHLASCAWADVEIFQVAEVIAAPGRAVKDEVDETVEAFAVAGDRAMHRFGTVKEACPSYLGRRQTDIYLVKRLVLGPKIAPLLEVPLFYWANR